MTTTQRMWGSILLIVALALVTCTAYRLRSTTPRSEGSHLSSLRPPAREANEIRMRNETASFPADTRPVASVAPTESLRATAEANDLSRGREEDMSVSDLPLPFSKEQMAQFGFEVTWVAQDAVMRKWPAYSEVREALAQQIGQQLHPENAPVEELRMAAKACQEMFWASGGESSPDSYKAIYQARLRLEYARGRDPNNLEVVDELIETIQSAQPVFMMDPNTRKRQRNVESDRAMFELRSQQFEQLTKETSQTRAPSKADFIRAVDLATVASIYDNAKAKKVVEWLIANAEHGGWSTYYNRLLWMQDRVNEGTACCFNIYQVPRDQPDQIGRFTRHYPSFVGPDSRARQLRLW